MALGDPMKRERLHLLAALVVALSGFKVQAVAQGSLTPPAAPAPTMKSLDQISSTGIALNATNTPGDASNHFIISQPGSYYLTGNLAVTETNAIRVAAPGVTIDLNGFQISSTNATPGDGINIRPGSDHCTVKNGSITGFALGVDTTTQSAKNCRFLDLAVSGCTNWGIRAGEGAVLESCRVHDCSGVSAAIGAGVASTLRDCTASHNTNVNVIQALSGSTLINCTASNNSGGTSGILTGDTCALVNCAVSSNTVTNGFNIGNGCALNNCAANGNTGTGGINTGESNVLTNCVARSNNVNNGILVGNGSSLFNCAASSNTGNLAISAGIATNDGCRVINCSAYHNQTNAGTPTNATGMGFNLGSDNIIQECLAYDNKGDGIRVNTACRVLFSTTNASNGGDCAGIHATGGSNLIEGNRVVTNPRGIQIDGTSNFIIRNMVFAEFGYIIAGNNVVGVIVNVPLSGAIGAPSYTGGVGLGTTDPWANFLQ